jgi:hypothetical protein
VVAAPGVLPIERHRRRDRAPHRRLVAAGIPATVIENEYDAELAARPIPPPRDPKRAKIRGRFPKKDALAAAYRTYSLVVRE